MSSNFGFGQNPNTALTTLPQKIIKKIVAKNKSSKKSRKTQNNNNNNNNNNSVNNSNDNKPLKVVYISNPMKFKVNADEFQTLVQGLTGRDAVEWPDETFNNLAQEVASINNGVVDDEVVDNEVQQEPSIMFDDQVDYFGPLDGDDNDGMLINMEDIQAFMFSDDL
ncbi:hypothetical protein RND81_14G041300 [Saponaria officinalis]|uniref:VQ domain-containing protein n=1 Tax=Saponaria officinalis TaxID=3572 RepID=A0AAW1GSB1_SAPOF